ncbi:long-chain fatty acid--CoA ligase [Mycolicibacterium moriokaense]|nr:long-chain fatty acid--CoA ligase [Mycolicibacterium moriokaense]
MSKVRVGGVAAAIRSTLAARAEATALLIDEKPCSYSDLAVLADALAAAMRADGMAGERVALMLPNGIDLVTSYLACFASGAVAAPLNARYALPEVEQALRRARPRWLIASADRLAVLKQIDSSVLSGVRIVVAGEDITTTPGGAQSPDIAPETEAVIFFTSGSTGRPKGVVHTHASALATLTSTSEALGGVRADDVVQVFEPLVHVSGFIATFSTLLAGGTVALYDGFDPDRYVRALTTDRPTLVCTHIDVLAQLLRLPGVTRDWFASLRGVYVGGDTVSERVQREFTEVSGLPIGVGYGMTEAIWLTVQRLPRTDAEGCIGRPVGGARLRSDPKTGELLVAGPMVMQRYWDDEALTAATLVDGWLHTGDLGHQDADGVWWFTGRLKDVIVRRTSKITPGEVEAVLDQHPAVAMAAVVGVADADEGQVPVAFVVPRRGTVLTADELFAFAAERIAHYKIPVRIHLRSSLPLTASGKISRRDLRE